MNPRPSDHEPGSGTATSANTAADATAPPNTSASTSPPGTADLPAAPHTALSTTSTSTPGSSDLPGKSAPTSATAQPSTSGSTIPPGTSTTASTTAPPSATSAISAATTQPSASADTSPRTTNVPPGTSTTASTTAPPSASTATSGQPNTSASTSPRATNVLPDASAPASAASAPPNTSASTSPPGTSTGASTAVPPRTNTAASTTSHPGATSLPGASTVSSTTEQPAPTSATDATRQPQPSTTGLPAASTVSSTTERPAPTSATGATRQPPASAPAPAAAPPHPTGLAAGLLAWFAERPPAAGSAVMATGIISVGLRQVGASVLSYVALALAGVLWLALAEDFARRLLWERGRWASESHTPAALTGVAATTVLGVRVSLAGWQGVAVALLVLAAVLWPLLLWAVLRHLKPNMPGAVFLICVATQGMATLGATLAAALPARWLLWPALVLFVFGLGLYLYALGHFDVAGVRDGAGDHWVAGGALAISALACAKLTEAKYWTGALHSTLRVTALVLIALAWTWCVVLAAAEIRWPRLHYDVRRWATLFPIGMIGAATSEVAKATGWSHLTGLGHTMVWIAAAAWIVVFIGLVRDVTGQIRHTDPGEPAPATKHSG
ncbi:tellurite resistance protein TehA-like permease [Catenulispora sp. EB89]|uniref:tellurite resistance/C4-dicarboxylate transporter family protein n=1 Tax=Catenulispora sp. EB89 TaxID=3156257 RepID=UPI003519C9C4